MNSWWVLRWWTCTEKGGDWKTWQSPCWAASSTRWSTKSFPAGQVLGSLFSMNLRPWSGERPWCNRGYQQGPQHCPAFMFLWTSMPPGSIFRDTRWTMKTWRCMGWRKSKERNSWGSFNCQAACIAWHLGANGWVRALGKSTSPKDSWNWMLARRSTAAWMVWCSLQICKNWPLANTLTKACGVWFCQWACNTWLLATTLTGP